LYEGLTLLSEDKKVFVSCVRGKTPTFNEDQGTSFDSIPFRGPKESAHKLLVFYRQDRGHAMGQKHTAVAFELKQGPRTIGWLVFSLDMDHVKKAYGMDEEGLERLEFKRI
jgi:hypothetical protein